MQNSVKWWSANGKVSQEKESLLDSLEERLFLLLLFTSSSTAKNKQKKSTWTRITDDFFFLAFAYTYIRIVAIIIWRWLACVWQTTTSAIFLAAFKLARPCIYISLFLGRPSMLTTLRYWYSSAAPTISREWKKKKRLYGAVMFFCLYIFIWTKKRRKFSASAASIIHALVLFLKMPGSASHRISRRAQKYEGWHHSPISIYDAKIYKVSRTSKEILHK